MWELFWGELFWYEVMSFGWRYENSVYNSKLFRRDFSSVDWGDGSEGGKN